MQATAKCKSQQDFALLFITGVTGCSQNFVLGYKILIFDIQYTPISNKSRGIAGRTVRCRCKFRYALNFTTAQCGFSAQHGFLVYISYRSNAEITHGRDAKPKITAHDQNHGKSL